MFLHNYHTHTKRCHHAVGEDREYIESAIQSGLKTLGLEQALNMVKKLGLRLRIDPLL